MQKNRDSLLLEMLSTAPSMYQILASRIAAFESELPAHSKSRDVPV